MQRVNAFIKKLRQPTPYNPNKIPISLTPNSRNINKQNIKPTHQNISYKSRQTSQFNSTVLRQKCIQHPNKYAQFQQQKCLTMYCGQCAIRKVKQTNVRIVKINKNRTYIRKLEEEYLIKLQNWKDKVIGQISQIFDVFRSRIEQYYHNEINNVSEQIGSVEILKFEQGIVLRDRQKLQGIFGKLIKKKVGLGDLNIGDQNLGDLNLGDRNIGDLNIGDLNRHNVKVKQYSCEDIPTSQISLQNGMNEELYRTRKSLLSNRNSYRNIKLIKKRNVTTQQLKDIIQNKS